MFVLLELVSFGVEVGFDVEVVKRVGAAIEAGWLEPGLGVDDVGLVLP